MIDNLRHLKSIEDGTQKMNLDEVNIHSMLNDFFSFYSSKFEDKKIILIKNIDIPKDATLLCSEINFQNQILTNAFSNAIKFSNIGSKICFNAFIKNGEYIL